MLSVSYLNCTQKIKGFGSETRQLFPFEIFHDRGFHPFLLFVRVSKVNRSSMSPRYYSLRNADRVSLPRDETQSANPRENSISVT